MKKGFTLAEVLITLGIIGVVAAITVPTLVANQNAKVFKTRKAVAELKIGEITRQMNFYDALAPHLTTTSFVNSLKNYVKVGKICDSNNLTDCFAEQITKSSGEVVEIKDLKNSVDLGKEYADTNVAFTILDGLAFIMSYDNSCVAPDKYNSELSTTSCLSYVLDVNGQKGPNIVGEDVVLVNASLPGGGCDGIEFNEICVASEDIEYECELNTGQGCNIGDPCDCYKAANAACAAIGMRAPTASEALDMDWHSDELGNPATAMGDFSVFDEYDENAYTSMKESADADPEYTAFMLYLYTYNGVYSGVQSNKIRCVK